MYIPVPVYTTNIFAYDKYQKSVVELLNQSSFAANSGNFFGVQSVPIYQLSNSIATLVTGTTKVDIQNHVGDLDTYNLIVIDGVGTTQTVSMSSIKMYFSDGWSGTIQESVDRRMIDRVFLYNAVNSSTLGWDMSSILTGGTTNGQSKCSAYFLYKLISEKTLTHFEVKLSSGGHVLKVGKTNITKINKDYQSALITDTEPYGEKIFGPMDLSHTNGVFTGLVVDWEEFHPYSNSTVSLYACITDNKVIPSVSEFLPIQKSIKSLVIPEGTEIFGKHLWIKVTITSSDVKKPSAVVSNITSEVQVRSKNPILEVS